MNRTYLPNYNLRATLLGGQSFSWKLIGDTFYGSTQDKVIKIKRDGDYILWQTYPQKDDWDFMHRYFNMDFDYPSAISKISKDENVKNAIKANPDLRLLRQDFHLTTLSFILSSFKNIKGIRHSVNRLSEKFGDKMILDNQVFYLFPKTEVLADANLEDLTETSIGYRAKYLKNSAKDLLKFDEDLLKLDDDTQTRVQLKGLDGIGNKVADCIMVFALGFENIMPLDVWGQRVLVNLYGLDKRMSYLQMQEWVKGSFQGHAALAGQFLFEYVREVYHKSPKCL
jgi:N-glycosylase/DNA lyase